MSLSLDFVEDTAVFRNPPEYDACTKEFLRILEERDSGLIGETSYVERLEDLAERHPWFIDAHVHVGNAHLDGGRTETALDAYRTGFALGEAAIPSGYAGLIDPQRFVNRPFFHAAHGLALCHLHLRQWNEAIDVMNATLIRDPEDLLGIRFLLGSALLRARRLEEARALLVEFRSGEPSLHYELALLRWLDGLFPAAATSLRQGFVANGYVAEMICGTPHPLPLAIWHRSSLAGPDCARSYVDLFGELWQHTPGAVAFMRWLHTHPEVMAERAAILACDEELLWEQDAGRRDSLAERRDILANAIDGRLSDRIVTKRVGRDGNAVWPWLNVASRR